MSVRSCVVLLLVLCFVSGASAQSTLRVSPARLQPGDEAFLTIFVSGLTADDVITVTFSGPGGQHSVAPNFVDGSTIVVWVPEAVMFVEGRYSVDVHVTRATGSVFLGRGFLDIAFPPPPENPPPLLSWTEVVVAEALTAAGANVDLPVTSNDGSPVVCNPASGSLFPLGTTDVRCSATNAGGTTSVDFVVRVSDLGRPTLTVPGDIVTSNPLVTFTATATDAIDPSPDVFCFPGSGQVFSQGTTTVNCFAVDDHANFDFGSFKVTVTGAGVPVLTVPADIVAEATSPNGAVVTFTATATEGAAVTCRPASGSTFALGATTVSCTATNANGSDSDSFTVTVVDSTAPVILSVRASPDQIWPPNHKMVGVTVTVDAVDAADPAVACRIVNVTSNQPINGPGDGNTEPDWQVTGPLTADLRAERAGNVDRVYRIWVQCVDDSGNFSTSKGEVRVSQSRRRSAR